MRLRFDLFITHDRGATWNVTTLDHSEDARPDQGHIMADPVLAFLPDGTLLIVGATLDFIPVPNAYGVLMNVDLWVARSPDGGYTIEERVVLRRSGRFVADNDLPVEPPALGALGMGDFPDKPWIAAGKDGFALLAWTQTRPAGDGVAGQPAGIWYAATQDGGRTWSAPGVVAPGGDVQGSSIAIGAEGAWYVAYRDGDRAEVSVSRDEGRTWAVRTLGPTAYVMMHLALRPGRAVDELVLAVPEPVGGSGRERVVLYRSVDAGATWAGPDVVAEPEAGDRTLPMVAARPDGLVYLTYVHSIAVEKTEFRAIALHPDGRNETTVLDPHIATTGRRLGDYLGIARSGGGAFAVWVTTADGAQTDVAGAYFEVPT